MIAALRNAPRSVAATTVSTFVFLIFLAGPQGFGQAGARPAAAAPVPPTDEPLLTRAPFDRLILKDATEVSVDPLAPRPLPPPKKYARRPPSRKKSEELEAREREIEKDPAIRLFVTPTEADGTEYAVFREDITDVVYFEDMLLQEADRLIAAGDYPKAFEYLLFVQNRDAKWRGLSDTHRRLLVAEARQRFAAGDLTAGLQFVTEALAKNPRDAESRALAVDGLSKLAEIDLAASRYERARESQAKMKGIDANAPAVNALAEKLRTVARNIMADAPADRPERLDRLNEAYRAWPETEGLAAARSEAMLRWPTVNVGVREPITEPPKLWGGSPAQERVADLAFRPLLEDVRESSYKGEPPGQLLARLEVVDLTTMVLTLKPDQKWSDGRSVNARDVVATFRSWAEPSSPAFHGAWAGVIESVTAENDLTIRTKFSRPVIQPDFWFLRGIMPAETAQTVKVSQDAWIGSGDFRWLGNSAQSQGQESVFERNASLTAGPYRLREIVFEDDGEAWQSLVDGRVDIIEHVPSNVTPDKAPPNVAVADYAVPEVHVLAVDGRRPLMANRSFRRGLAYALNRSELLEEQFLGRAPRPNEIVADGVFVKGSTWDDPEVRPLPSDTAMATLLFASAKREMKLKSLAFTLDYQARTDVARVAARIADALSVFGVTVTLKKWTASELEESLRAGKPFDVAWRVVSPTTNHFLVGGAIAPAIFAPPQADGLAALASPVILAQVLDLERSFNETEMRSNARFVDRLCRQELPLIPLWQVPKRYAWRKSLSGLAPNAERLYGNVRDWTIRPTNEAK